MRRFNFYKIRSWLIYIKVIVRQLIIPFTIFQGVRTVMLPTTFDVMLLAILVMLALSFYLKWW